MLGKNSKNTLSERISLGPHCDQILEKSRSPQNSSALMVRIPVRILKKNSKSFVIFFLLKTINNSYKKCAKSHKYCCHNFQDTLITSYWTHCSSICAAETCVFRLRLLICSSVIPACGLPFEEFFEAMNLTINW